MLNSEHMESGSSGPLGQIVPDLLLFTETNRSQEIDRHHRVINETSR